MSPLITIASSGMDQGVHYIFCPFAGGGSGSLRAWRNLNLVKESVSVMLYPGRETRIDDATIENIESLAEEMIQALLASRIPIEKTIIVGHSMGAQVAYEASRKLLHQGHTPKGLVISGCQAPHIKGRRLLSKCDDTTFIANLIEMGDAIKVLLIIRNGGQYFFRLYAQTLPPQSNIFSHHHQIEMLAFQSLLFWFQEIKIKKPTIQKWRNGSFGAMT